jgi:hypothetical protein
MGIRRGQALGLALTVVIIYFLFFAGSDNTDFRRTTEASLSRRRGILRGSLSDADLTAHTNRELQKILDKQKSLFDQTVLSADGEEVAVAGRVSMPRTNDKPRYPVAGSPTGASGGKGEETALNANHVEEEPLDGESMAREELQAILKKSPSKYLSASEIYSVDCGPDLNYHSHHLLQVLLSLFQARQSSPPRDVYHFTYSLRC